MHDLNALRRKIASARQEVRNLTRPAAGPAAAPRGAGQEPGDFGAGGGNGPAEASGSRPQDADPGQVTAPSHEKLPPSLIDKAGNIRLDKLNQPEDIDQVIRDLAARDNNFIAERRHVISDEEAIGLADRMVMDGHNHPTGTSPGGSDLRTVAPRGSCFARKSGALVRDTYVILGSESAPLFYNTLI